MPAGARTVGVGGSFSLGSTFPTSPGWWSRREKGQGQRRDVRFRGQANGQEHRGGKGRMARGWWSLCDLDTLPPGCLLVWRMREAQM